MSIYKKFIRRPSLLPHLIRVYMLLYYGSSELDSENKYYQGVEKPEKEKEPSSSIVNWFVETAIRLCACV